MADFHRWIADVGGRGHDVEDVTIISAGVGGPARNFRRQTFPETFDWWERDDVQGISAFGLPVSTIFGDARSKSDYILLGEIFYA